MKIKIKQTDRSTESWKGATARGALIWGSVYSTATTGATCLVSSAIDGHLAINDIFAHSLIIFPPLGAMRGLIMWRVRMNTERVEDSRRKEERMPKPSFRRLKKAA